MATRLRGRFGYPEDNPFRVTLHPGRVSSLEPALRGTGKIIFVCSMGDLFHQDVPESFIREILKLVTATGQHTFFMLTKRPERMRNVFESYYATGAAIIRNLWLGVTAENQARANERIPVLLQIPAAVRFVSVEPMLGPVDLSKWLGECNFCGSSAAKCGSDLWKRGKKCCPDCTHNGVYLNWIICGGETGPGARPMHPDWVRSLRNQCQEAGIPFFFKSWGDYGIFKTYLHAYKKYAGELVEFRCVASSDCHRVGKITWHAYPKDAADDYRDIEIMERIGKKRAGRLLDGRTWDEMPKPWLRGDNDARI
jgi:protein gp37